MFKITYKIVTERFQGIEYISDEEIRYNFLLGNVSLVSSELEIEMQWGWIPLLDFSYCLQMISNDLKVNSVAREFFEFTENAETLEFSRENEQISIAASFSSVVIETTFLEFEKSVRGFHLSISEYIRAQILSEPPNVLQKYLS